MYSMCKYIVNEKTMFLFFMRFYFELLSLNQLIEEKKLPFILNFVICLMLNFYSIEKI